MERLFNLVKPLFIRPKSLHFSMAVRIKWSNAGIMLGHGKYFIHQMALYLNTFCHLLT